MGYITFQRIYTWIQKVYRNAANVVQETENVSSRKMRVAMEVIHAYTGRPPKDAYEIRDLIHVIEQHLSDFEIEDFNLPVDGNRRGTLPIDCDVWDKFTDWQTLDEGQKQETQTFLLMNFSVEDLQLAYDQYFVQRGHIPSSVAYRIFINNWRGNEMRRTQSLAEMVTTIGQQVEEIERGREEKQIKISQLNFITAIRDGLLRRGHDLENENEHLHKNVLRLERDCEQERHDKDRLREVINSQDRKVYELEQNVNKKVHQLFDSNRELKDTKDELKHTKDELKNLREENVEQRSTINEQSATINGLQGTVNEQSATVSGLQGTVNEQSATVNGLQATVNEQSATINGLQGTVNEQSATVSGLQGTVNEQSATINELKATIKQITLLFMGSLFMLLVIFLL